jgi:hypothetical protein
MKNTLRRQHGGYARQQRRASVGACVNECGAGLK